MEAQFSLKNDHGTVLIDQSYSNLALRAKGVIKLDKNGVGHATIENCSMPVAVVRPSTTSQITASYSLLKTSSVNIYVSGNPNGSANWYLFDVPTKPASYGLVLYRADGTVAFDATKKYLQIVDTWSGSTFAASSGSRTYPAGRTYGVVPMKLGYMMHHFSKFQAGDPGGMPGQWIESITTTRSTFALNGRKLTLSTTEETRDGPRAPKGINYTDQSPSWFIAVADITNY